MLKKTVITLTIFLLSSLALAQEMDDPFRLSIKTGSPNIIGLGCEYLVPLGGLSMGLDVDGSYFPLKRKYLPFLSKSFEDITFNIMYFALGPRLFFDENGKGFSIGFYYGRYLLEIIQDYHYLGQTASATAKVGANIYLGKIGYRWFFGRAFLGVEAGYGIGKLDDTLEITVTYPKTGKRKEEYDIKDILPVAHGFVGTFEAGIAF
jgi:hypothetical protein